MLLKQLCVGEMEVFCYILGCEETRQGVLIDPGGTVKEILPSVEERDLEIRFIINTHCHPDHTCGNGMLQKATHAKIVLHEADHALLKDKEAAEYFGRMGFPPSPPADILVKDNDVVVFGNYSLEVLHTPGHSPGGICLYCDGNLFSGDTLFAGAAGRVDVPGGDFNVLINSLAEKILPLPDETVIWPGHDYSDASSTTLGREKKENPYLGGEW